ncbi:MAG: efflux RND transporter periplasmic adaptor subunit [Rhodospirillales bacterium]
MKLKALTVLPLLAALLGCGEDAPPETEKVVRAIRAMEVVDRSSGELRSFPGVVRAVDLSQLAFEVAGNTREVVVSQGDRITRGMVLATLDPAPYELNVESAEADVGRAQAELNEKTTDLDRQQKLFAKGWVAKAALDQAQSAYDSAENQVRYARSRLNLAKRDLEKTVLAAPFDGIVAERLVEPFQEVARGAVAFEAYVEEAMEVAVNIPETVVGGISQGQTAEAIFPGDDIGTLTGRVTEVSSAANDANTFEVVVTLDSAPPKVRPGMSATLELLLGGDGGDAAYLVPLSAILPGETQGRGYVFVFQPDSSTVRKQEVGGSGVQDNLIMVNEGIASGDIIATAGVTFLRDGQEVRLSEPQ